MQPLPCDMTTFEEGPFQGRSFVEVASYPAPEDVMYATQVIEMALTNKPVAAEVYRFAAYLYARLKLVSLSAMMLLKSSSMEPHQLLGKRTQDPSAMEAARAIQVPLQQDPLDFQHVSVHFCDVMIGENADEQHGDLVDFSDGSVDVTVNYALTASDAPGLAILDSGCTRTMHGSEWSSAFEDALKQYDLMPQTKSKLQRFRGVGGETVSDLSNSTVSFKALGVQNFPLIKTSRPSAFWTVATTHMALFPALPFPSWKLQIGLSLQRPLDLGLRLLDLSPRALDFARRPIMATKSQMHRDYSLPSDAMSSTGGNYPPYDPEYDWGLCDELDLLRPPPDGDQGTQPLTHQ